MLALLIGLVLFLGIHSVGMVAHGWRNSMVERLGRGPWMGLYALVSLVGFVLIVWGFGQARMAPTWVWVPPVWTRHMAALLTLPAFILLVAAYLPGSHIKSRVGHPMLLGTKVWALAHLLSNGTLHEIILFGSFLAWSVALFIVLRKRDRANAIHYPVVGLSRDIAVIVVGIGAWVAFALWLHRVLIGVHPFFG